jgi:hypothetical protein
MLKQTNKSLAPAIFRLAQFLSTQISILILGNAVIARPGA